MLTTELSSVQTMIYGRRRIINTILKQEPDAFGSIRPTDIKHIELADDLIGCHMENSLSVYISRADVIKNFWEHRTRTPSFFEYKIWSAYATNKIKGTPVGAIDHNVSMEDRILANHMSHAPRVALDENGAKKLYFVQEEREICSCDSWMQLNEYSKELSDEFKAHSDIKFRPMCKHIMWAQANAKLQSFVFKTKEKNGQFNPRLCVYYYDYKRGTICYRITHDGVRTNGQWFPVDGWKEKSVYTVGNMPTGACWDTLISAMDRPEPFKIVPYSLSLANLMVRTGRR